MTMGSIDTLDEDTAPMKENKKEIANKLLTRILSLLKNNEEEKPKKNSEVISLVQEFHKQYQSLYAQYDRLRGEIGKRFRSRKEKDNSLSMETSDSEFYSSEEIENDVTEHDYGASDSETENSELLSPASIENEAQTWKLGTRKDKKSKGNERKREVYGREAAGQIKELEEQLSMVQADLESSRKQNYDVQVQIEEKETQVQQIQESNAKLQSRVSELEQTLQNKGNEILEATLKMAKSEKALTSKIEILKKQVNERSQESVQFQVLKNEMKSMKEEIAKKAKLEQELLKEKETVLVQMQDLKSEMNSLLDQRNELEKTITSKTGEADKLREEKDSLQKEFDYLVSEKKKMPKQSSENNLAEVERETLNQTNSKEEQHKLVKSQSLDIQKLQKVESSRYRMDSAKFKNHQALERKISEIADKFQMRMDNQIRLLSQRIKVAEHIYTDTSKKVIEKLKRENKELNEKNETYEAEAKKLAESNIISGMDLMARKLDEENEKLMYRISRISDELQVARKWVTEKNDETSKMKQDLERFSTEQDYERMMGDLKQQLEERNEEKKEAIKQLCVMTDYYRHRYDQLKEAVSKMPTKSKK